MDRGAWKSTVHGVAKELDTLRDCIFAPAKRSYPTSKVRGSGREYQTATAQEWLRGATLRPRSGAGTAERRYPASEVRGGGREELLHAPSLRPGATGGRSYPTPLSPRPRAAAGRSNRTTEARGGGREDQPHIQGALAVWAQEGLEELFHVEGQEGRR